eukprot:2282044-Amphidinium_carterae.1
MRLEHGANKHKADCQLPRDSLAGPANHCTQTHSLQSLQSFFQFQDELHMCQTTTWPLHQALESLFRLVARVNQLQTPNAPWVLVPVRSNAAARHVADVRASVPTTIRYGSQHLD